jgi:hypothetical protein
MKHLASDVFWLVAQGLVLTFGVTILVAGLALIMLIVAFTAGVVKILLILLVVLLELAFVAYAVRLLFRNGF